MFDNCITPAAATPGWTLSKYLGGRLRKCAVGGLAGSRIIEHVS